MVKEGYIKKEDRKKILLLTDDIRVHSGVAQIGREMVLNTCHRYNWVQIAGAVKHPDKGKKVDMSKAISEETNVEDANIILYPTDGYGTPDMVRQMIKEEEIDAIFLITDPRYFTWLFQMENEIRRKVPIAYLNIWDDYPAPSYNKEFYNSCDALFGISKQTVNINELVLGEDGNAKIIKYVPHGLNNKMFFPIEDSSNEFEEFKTQLTKGRDKEFILLFNSRNIRRKSIPDTLLAWRYFLDQITPEQASKCLLALHTQPVDQNGTDLPAIIDYLFPTQKEQETIIISNNKLSSPQMNMLYNCADGVILLSSNEGWGLSLTEALLTGTPIIANVTGGMQDQMRFVDENSNWFKPDAEVPSNHTGKYKECGEWALPVFPSNRSLVGSVPTPYIWDDRCNAEDATEQIMALYQMSKEERKRRGEEGRKWATGDEAGFTSEKMSDRIIEGMEELFQTWTPRKKYTFSTDEEFEPRVLKHKLLY